MQINKFGNRYLLVVSIAILSLGFFWLPFLIKIENFWGINFAKAGMDTIVRNFDGLNFIVVAKSWYNPVIIEEINRQFLTGNTPIYFSAHYPAFAAIVSLLHLILSYPTALLITIIISNILLAIGLLYFYETLIVNTKTAMVLAVLTLFFPARMLAVRAVGSNEPLFIFLVLVSLAWAYKGKSVASAIVGSLAVVTRSPGILLFGAYMLAAIASYNTDWKKILNAIWPYLIMPLTLLGLFIFYGVRYGSVFAYFQSGDNLHLFFPPFQIFSNLQSWIADMWREDIIYQYLFYGLGIGLYLSKVAKECGFRLLATPGYGVIYGLVLLMVAHRDLARYALPVAPVVYLGYSELITQVHKKYYWLLVMALIPIYLFGWQFVLSNVQPINDWSALL